MTTSYLWPNIDSYLKTQLLADLGLNSSTYSTLKLAEATVGQTIDPAHATTPSLLIASTQAFPTFQSHGGGTVRIANQYPYLLLILDRVKDETTAGPPAVDSYIVLKANMQEHMRRLITWLAGHWALPGVTPSSDLEAIQKMELVAGEGGAQVDLWGPEEGYFYGLAGVAFRLETEQ